MSSVYDYRNGGEGFISWCNNNIFIPVYASGETIPQWRPICDLPSKINSVTGRSPSYMWKKHQEIAVSALEMDKDHRFIHRLVVLCWPRGEGKCQQKGSTVLMYDGTIKKVEDVVVGDLLMGEDNKSKKVLSLANGFEEMFKIVPYRGKSLTVTADHMLSLKGGGSGSFVKRGKTVIDKKAGEVIDITVKDYLKQNKAFKNKYHLFKVPIDWPEQNVPIDPYFLGLWLGDGHSHTSAVTTMDEEIVNYLHKYARSVGTQVVMREKSGENKASTYFLTGWNRTRDNNHRENPLLDTLRNCKLINNKHIPQVYKANSREVRLQVLAGLVDSDGYINRNSVQFIMKSKKLSKDILFIARSLGFHAEMKKCEKSIKSINFTGTYYRIGISGDCSIIPTKIARKKAAVRSNWKDILITGIKEIKSVGEKEYYGFTLDGNGRYVTGDFTVTHNSFLVCLFQLWKFFCFPKQLIVLGANSKDQVKFVHFEVIKDIIKNSPNLLRIIGMKNIQEKEIRMKNKRGDVVSFIRPLSSFSGIVSNITGYTFSEIFAMKNPKFFSELHGSIRAVPNALGTIDTTVSSKTHFLYRQMYKPWIEKKDPTLFFHHRTSPTASSKDYWNPEMTQQQLDSYRSTLPNFDQFFLNTWDSAAKNKLCSDEAYESCKYIGFKDKICCNSDINTVFKEIKEIDSKIENFDKLMITNSRKYKTLLNNSAKQKKELLDSLILMPELQGNQLMDIDTIAKLNGIFNTDFCLLAGLDRADPMKASADTGARTMLSFVLKGMYNSKFIRHKFTEEMIINYIYIPIGIFYITDSLLSSIQEILLEVNASFGIDKFCSERWGVWDMMEWLKENDIEAEVIHPTYERQKTAFTNLFEAVNNGRFKCNFKNLIGYKGMNLLEEEMKFFTHDIDKRRFVSEQKTETDGVQDDLVYSLGWAVYGGRDFNLEHFRSMTPKQFFGMYVKP